MGDVTSGLDAAMTLVGDRWTLLVVDALLDGPRRFSELQEAIPGLAPNVLTARLRRLEHDGLITGTPYSDRPPRLEYRVSEAGRELAGAVRLLARWGRATPAARSRARTTDRAARPSRPGGTAPRAPASPTATTTTCAGSEVRPAGQRPVDSARKRRNTRRPADATAARSGTSSVIPAGRSGAHARAMASSTSRWNCSP